MTTKKGFRAAKTLTKQQIIDNHGDQMGKLNGQVQNLTQMVIQSSQHLRQMQEEVGLLATLLRYSRETTPSVEGDFVVIDCIGQAKQDDGTLGLPFPGGTLFTHAVELNLEAGRYVPGFVDGLVGRKVHDRFDLTVTFPEDYHLADVSGREVVFDTVVLGVYRPSASSDVIMTKDTEFKEQAAALAAEETATADTPETTE